MKWLEWSDVKTDTHAGDSTWHDLTIERPNHPVFAPWKYRKCLKTNIKPTPIPLIDDPSTYTSLAKQEGEWQPNTQKWHHRIKVVLASGKNCTECPCMKRIYELRRFTDIQNGEVITLSIVEHIKNKCVKWPKK